jgi:hypothetical protein
VVSVKEDRGSRRAETTSPAAKVARWTLGPKILLLRSELLQIASAIRLRLLVCFQPIQSDGERFLKGN